MTAKVTLKESKDLDGILAKLPIELRGKALADAMKAAGKIVMLDAKKRIPRGDPSHKPDKKPLADSLGVKVKGYNQDRRMVAIIGAKWPEGAHLHLIEFGHKVRQRGAKGEGPGEFTGAFVPGKRVLGPAIDTTEAKQDAAIRESLAKSIKKAGG